jgi:hypothetical protein
MPACASADSAARSPATNRSYGESPDRMTSDVTRERLRHHRLVDARARGSFREREIHLVRILDRLKDLPFKGSGAAVPEERLAVAAVEQGQ